jgi:hypothetical protein
MYWGPFVLDHCRKWLCTTFSQQTIVPCVLLAENVKLPILPVALQKLEAETGCSLVWAGPAAKAGRSFREHTAGIVFSQSVFFFPMKSAAAIRFVPRGRHMFPSPAPDISLLDSIPRRLRPYHVVLPLAASQWSAATCTSVGGAGTCSVACDVGFTGKEKKMDASSGERQVVK